jgi:signal transduction histidine kinase
LPAESQPSSPASRPSRIVLAAVYFLYTAVVLRTLVNQFLRPLLPAYLGLEFVYLLLVTLALVRPAHRPLWQHLYFVIQSLLVLVLIWLHPKFDFILILFVILSLQAGLVFPGRARWFWVAILALLTVIPLMVALGALQGLALALMPMAIGIVFSAYVTVTQEIEAGLRNRQVLVAELQETNRRLTVSAGQVEELSAIQERNRLARELHDSVSQAIFSISLHTRAAQILLARSPECLRPELEQLQRLTQSTLTDMRGLIAHLRPPEDGTGWRPKS